MSRKKYISSGRKTTLLQCTLKCNIEGSILETTHIDIECAIKTGIRVNCDENNSQHWQGGTPGKILKQKAPFEAFWCILVNYKNHSWRPKKRKSVKKLKTLMPVKNFQQREVYISHRSMTPSSRLLHRVQIVGGNVAVNYRYTVMSLGSALAPGASNRDNTAFFTDCPLRSFYLYAREQLSWETWMSCSS